MRKLFKESAWSGLQDFPMPWVNPDARTLGDHARHVADIARPQPPASIGDTELFLLPNVYHPGIGLSSRFLVDSLSNERLGRSVLDLGCGSGFVGISLYRSEMELVLADVSEAALASSAENLRRFGINAELISSDLFSSLRERRFDSILFNPPLFDKDIEHEAEIALCDPNGELLSRFLIDAPHYLAPGGRLYFTASNLMSRDALFNGLKPYRYDVVSTSACFQSKISRWIICAIPTSPVTVSRIS